MTCFEEKTGENLQKLGLGEEFLGMTQRHDPIKNEQATDWQQIFAYHISDKGLKSVIYKETAKPNSVKKQPTHVSKMHDEVFL